MILKLATRVRKTQRVCWGNVLEKVSSENQHTDRRMVLSLTVEMLGDERCRELDDECSPWRPSYYLYFSSWVVITDRQRERERERERVSRVIAENKIS